MSRPRKTPEQVKDIGLSKKEYKKSYVSLDDYTSASLENTNPINRTTAGYGYRDWSNILPGQSGKPSFTREDYEAFRPESVKPHKYSEVAGKCNAVYRNVGLIRNIIDLMGDFTSQGVRLVHPNKRIEQFHQNLWDIWNGSQVTERIANTLYRLATAPVQFYTMKLKTSEVEKLYRSTADADTYGLPNRLPNLESRELPYKYVILDPASIVPIGGPLASFTQTPTYGLILPQTLKNKIVAPANEQERAIVAQLPDDLVAAAKSNLPYLLDPEKTSVLYYKKDDWNAYPDPMIYSILDDIDVLQKLKLADLSALDGATSKIRIFKMGNMEHKIAPSPALADKLSEILQNNVGAGTTDIVWGPDIEILETAADTFNFLGDEKYQGTLNNIYAGMGIPPTLTGTFGAAGTTNNFISLKTLTERLEYGRSIISDFWNKQLRIVQSQMGFRFPAQIVFDRMVLGDEAAEKALLIQLAERNIMSDEMVQHLFKLDPELERIRVKREFQERDSGKRAPKAGSWYNEPDPSLKLKQIALQTGQVTPSEVGLELEEKKPGEKPIIDKQIALEKQKAKTAPGASNTIKKKPKGKPGAGRPKTSKDKQKRKKRSFRARSMMELWARSAQDQIAKVINPVILETFGKKNLRQLTNEESQQAEMIKFGVLANISPDSEITDEKIVASLNVPVSSQDKIWYKGLADIFEQKHGRTPSIDEARNLQIFVYSYKYKDIDNGQS